MTDDKQIFVTYTLTVILKTNTQIIYFGVNILINFGLRFIFVGIIIYILVHFGIQSVAKKYINKSHGHAVDNFHLLELY